MQPGEVIADRFEIEALAGAGGMGSVYRAYDRSTHARVALKVLLRESVHAARFAQEAELLCRLDHPQIVHYVAHGAPGGSGPAYIAMEWLDGVSLRQRLERGALGVDQSVDIARQCAAALSAAHELGIVHRDIKPENLFLTDGRLDQVRVLDFGVALAQGAGQRMTRTGTPLGTIGYMAPEQVHGDTRIDARADLFSLGTVLFECLTGVPAFAAEHPLAVLAKLVFEDPPPLEDLAPLAPPELAALLARLLEKNPEGRPASAAEVLATLSGFSLPQAAAPPRPTRRPPSLTVSERIVTTAIVSESRSDEHAATLPAEISEASNAKLHAIVTHHGGRFEPLTSSSFIALFSGRGVASDAAARAARSALEIRRAEPTRPLALVTGYAIAGGRLPIVQVVERAMGLLQSGNGSGLPIDDVTAGLLPTSFSLQSHSHGLELTAERVAAPPARLLLGRVGQCVGRDRELSTLGAIAEECFTGPVAQAAVLSGPPGVGKSRVRHELLGHLVRQRPSPEIWIGRGSAVSAGSPFALLASALRGAFGLVEETRQLARRKLRARVSRHVPTSDVDHVTHFLGEALGLHFPESQDEWLRAARQDPILMGDQIQRAWTVLLEHECRAHPLVLVLEDLHWGDVTTVKLVDAALRRLHETPLLVVAVGRSEMFDLFPSLWAERRTHHVRVRELPRRAAREIAQKALGTDISEPEITQLVETAGGNALFLEELIRAHAEGRTETPESVLAMVQSRVERLEGRARRLLRAGSIFGDCFWRGAGEALVADVEPSSVDEWLDTLTEREVLTKRSECRFPSEVEYTFRSALLRDATYAMLTESDRELGHRLAAAWLEAHGERDPKSLALHYERGGMRGAAAPWWEQAALAALDANDFTAALDCVARGVAAGATGERLGSLKLVESDALRWTGALDEAMQTLEQAFELLPPGTPRWYHASAERALLLQRLGRGKELERLARQLMARSVRDPSAEGLSYAMARAALFCLISGRSELADQLAGLVEDFASGGVPLPAATRAQCSVLRGLKALYRADLGSYLQEEIAARRCFEEAGDARRALNESTSIGFAYLELGAFGEAQRTLEDALAGSERLGLVHVQAAALHNLGLVHAALSRFDEARSVEERALAIFREQKDGRLQGAALTYLAIIELSAANFEVAERTALDAVELVERVAPPIEPLARAVLSLATLRRGDASSALTQAERALAQLEKLGISESAETWARLAWAEALEAVKGRTAAQDAYERARARLQERAGCIEDEALRRSFLENVPENVRTLRLASRRPDGAG